MVKLDRERRENTHTYTVIFVDESPSSKFRGFNVYSIPACFISRCVLCVLCVQLQIKTEQNKYTFVLCFKMFMFSLEPFHFIIRNPMTHQHFNPSFPNYFFNTLAQSHVSVRVVFLLFCRPIQSQTKETQTKEKPNCNSL